MLEAFILMVHVGAAAALCLLVLLQHGKGADMGAAFGSGASGSLFGASGSANFLSRSTAIMATVFFLTSMGLTWYSGRQPQQAASVMDTPKVGQPAQPSKPPAGADSVPAPAAGGESAKQKDNPK
jgi:preprotein translocase subunit SecG